MTTHLRQYNQKSPTVCQFHASDAFIRGLMGPIGSGKSVACVMEIMRRAMAQRPDPSGRRRTRWAVIRNTYPELIATTIKTFQQWIPREIGVFKMSPPITHHILLPASDGTLIDCEVIFLALDKPDDVKKLLSLELTGAWLNEARELPKAVLDAASGRVGRYPSKMEGGCDWSGVIMDTNPPDDMHWWYRNAEEIKPEGWAFFRQAGGLSPDADNLENLPAHYYDRLIPGKSLDWVTVYVNGNYGSISDGKPVYPEFNDRIHVADKQLVPYKGLPLILGWDFGLTPSVAMMQITPRGQLRIIDELVSESMGIRQFAETIVKPHLSNRYDGMIIHSVADPAGGQRAQTDESTCLDELSQLNLPTEPAISNEFTRRREAVAGFLTRMVDGEPAFLLSPHCKMLRKGFAGGYHYRRMQVPGEEKYQQKPDKNIFSHIHDALQYGALSVEIDVRPRRRTRGRRQEQWVPADRFSGY